MKGAAPENAPPGNAPPGNARGRRWYDLPLEEWGAALLLAAMTIIAFAGTVSRYVFGTGIPYLEQFTPELFVWATFLGIAAAARTGSHLGADVLVRLLPSRGYRLMRLLVVLLSTVFFVTLIVYGWRGVQQDMRFGFTNALGLPNWWITVAMPVGGVLLILRTVQNFLTHPAAERETHAV